MKCLKSFIYLAVVFAGLYGIFKFTLWIDPENKFVKDVIALIRFFPFVGKQFIMFIVGILK